MVKRLASAAHLVALENSLPSVALAVDPNVEVTMLAAVSQSEINISFSDFPPWIGSKCGGGKCGAEAAGCGSKCGSGKCGAEAAGCGSKCGAGKCGAGAAPASSPAAAAGCGSKCGAGKCGSK